MVDYKFFLFRQLQNKLWQQVIRPSISDEKKRREEKRREGGGREEEEEGRKKGGRREEEEEKRKRKRRRKRRRRGGRNGGRGGEEEEKKKGNINYLKVWSWVRGEKRKEERWDDNKVGCREETRGPHTSR